MNNRAITLIISSLCFFTTCVPVSTPDSSFTKKLEYDNANYELNIGMVQLFPYNLNLQSELENPVIESGNPNGFFLRFDLFQDNYTSLSVKYVHCNADWRPSNLASMRFLNEYNSFPINDYSYSANTRLNYVQYSVTLPTPSIPGNYLVVVFKSGNDQDIILSRRALVFSKTSNPQGEIKMSSSVMNRNSHQQLNFSVTYQGLENVNPLRDLKIVLLQNHNWSTAIKGLQPTMIRHDQSYLEYFHFNSENNFPGANEFRFFDLRSIDYRGMNVAIIHPEENRVLAFLGKDKPRGRLAYSQLNKDMNGGYYLENRDPSDTQLQSEYVDVYFELLSNPIDGNVYIAGKYNNWQLNATNLMQYDEERKSYRGKLKLKQGYYDYMFWVESDILPTDYLEGNFFQTENEYEILVYYRNPINNFDELIGYRSIHSNF